MAKYDAGRANALTVERLAAKDKVFAANYTAAVHNQKYRQLTPTVTAWLVRQALARERRQERCYTPTQAVVAVEKELFS
jgi:hypothetical protein